MGWQERRYKGDYGEGGGFKRAMRRIFVEGDSFFSWAVPLFRVAGISVRIHILYIAIVIAKLVWPINPGVAGLLYTAFLIGTMFLFVLLHEFGHCFACRRVGGEADEIVMWPLGGLAMCRPPRNWKAGLITTLGGPAVNVLLALLLALVLVALGAGTRAVLFNPFDPYGRVVTDAWFNYPAAQWKILLYSAFQANVYLALFNLCLPMFPMDGGQVLRELLWSRMDESRATMIAANVGLVLAAVIGVGALATNQGLLFGICLFCALTCIQERRRAQFGDEARYGAGTGYAAPASDSAADKAYRAAAKRQQKERERRAEIDQILDKIRADGMGSLTRRERALLKEETERQRTTG